MRIKSTTNFLTTLGVCILINANTFAQVNPPNELIKITSMCCLSIDLELIYEINPQPSNKFNINNISRSICPSGRVDFEFTMLTPPFTRENLDNDYKHVIRTIDFSGLPPSLTNVSTDILDRFVSRAKFRISLPRVGRLGPGSQLLFRFKCADSTTWSNWQTYCTGVDEPDSFSLDGYLGGEHSVSTRPLPPIPNPPLPHRLQKSFQPSSIFPYSKTQNFKKSPDARPMSGNISLSDFTVYEPYDQHIVTYHTQTHSFETPENCNSNNNPLNFAPILDDFREVARNFEDVFHRIVRFTLKPSDLLSDTDRCIKVFVKTAPSSAYEEWDTLSPNENSFEIKIPYDDLPAKIYLQEYSCKDLSEGNPNPTSSECSQIRTIGGFKGCCGIEIGTMGMFWTSTLNDHRQDSYTGPPLRSQWQNANQRFIDLFKRNPIFPFAYTFTDQNRGFLHLGRYHERSTFDPSGQSQVFLNRLRDVWKNLSFISVPPGTRLTVYSRPSYNGEVILDVIGPALITDLPDLVDPNEFKKIQQNRSCDKQNTNTNQMINNSNFYNSPIDLYDYYYKNADWHGIYQSFPPPFRKYFKELIAQSYFLNLPNLKTIFTIHSSFVIEKLDDTCDEFMKGLNDQSFCHSNEIDIYSTSCDKGEVRKIVWKPIKETDCYIVEINNTDITPEFYEEHFVSGNNYLHNATVKQSTNSVKVYAADCQTGKKLYDNPIRKIEICCAFSCGDFQSQFSLDCNTKDIKWRVDTPDTIFKSCNTRIFSLIYDEINPVTGLSEAKVIGLIQPNQRGSEIILSHAITRLPIRPSYNFRVAAWDGCNSGRAINYNVNCGCPMEQSPYYLLDCKEKSIYIMHTMLKNTECNTGCFKILRHYNKNNTKQTTTLVDKTKPLPERINAFFADIPEMPENIEFEIEILYFPDCSDESNYRSVGLYKHVCFQTPQVRCKDNQADLVWDHSLKTGCYIIEVENKDVIPEYRAEYFVLRQNYLLNSTIKQSENTFRVYEANCDSGEKLSDEPFYVGTICCPHKCGFIPHVTLDCQTKDISWRIDAPVTAFKHCNTRQFYLNYLTTDPATGERITTRLGRISVDQRGTEAKLPRSITNLPIRPSYHFQVVSENLCGSPDSVNYEIRCGCPMEQSPNYLLDCKEKSIYIMHTMLKNTECNTGCFRILRHYNENNTKQTTTLVDKTKPLPNRINNFSVNLPEMPKNAEFEIEILYFPDCSEESNFMSLGSSKHVCLEPCDVPRTEFDIRCDESSHNALTVRIDRTPYEHCLVGNCFELQWRNSSGRWNTIQQVVSTTPVTEFIVHLPGWASNQVLQFRLIRKNDCNDKKFDIMREQFLHCLGPCPNHPFTMELDCTSINRKLNFTLIKPWRPDCNWRGCYTIWAIPDTGAPVPVDQNIKLASVSVRDIIRGRRQFNMPNDADHKDYSFYLVWSPNCNSKYTDPNNILVQKLQTDQMCRVDCLNAYSDFNTYCEEGLVHARVNLNTGLSPCNAGHFVLEYRIEDPTQNHDWNTVQCIRYFDLPSELKHDFSSILRQLNQNQNLTYRVVFRYGSCNDTANQRQINLHIINCKK